MAGPLRRPVHSFGCTGRGQGSLTGETRGKRQTLRAREAVKRCARLTPFATIRTRNLGRVSRPHTSRAREDPSPRPHPASGIRAAPRRLRAPCASTPGRGAGWGRQAARWGPGRAACHRARRSNPSKARITSGAAISTAPDVKRFLIQPPPPCGEGYPHQPCGARRTGIGAACLPHRAGEALPCLGRKFGRLVTA